MKKILILSILIALFACSEDKVQTEAIPSIEGSYVVAKITGLVTTIGVDGTRDTSISEYKFDHTELVITDGICNIKSGKRASSFYMYYDGLIYHCVFDEEMSPFSQWLEEFETLELQEDRVVIHSLFKNNDVTMYLFKIKD